MRWVLVVARLLKLGFIGDFLSTSVLVGFLTGVGIQVLSGQIPDMIGVPKGTGSWFHQQLDWIKEIPNTNLAAFGFAALTVACIWGFERFLPKVPGALVAVVLSIAISTAVDASADGVAVVGAVPSGPPPLGLPTGMDLHDVWLVLPTALSCFVLIIAQSAATSRSFAAKHGDRVDVNQDIVGLSGAEMAAGLSGTFVVNGSPTKTQILDGQGGKTQVANMTMAVVTLLFAMFFTGVLTTMPKATLAGIVFMIGLSLVDLTGLATIGRERRSELIVALLTAVTVFAIGVEQGIVLAVVASLIEIIRRAYHPTAFVVRKEVGKESTFLRFEPGVQSRPGLVTFRFDAEVFYANAGRFTDDIKALVDQAPDRVRWVLMDGSSLVDVDYSGGVQIRDLVTFLEARGTTVGLVGADDGLTATLAAYGVLGADSRVRVFAELDEAIAAFEASEPAPAG